MRAKALMASGLMAVLLAGCSDKAAELGAQWGCGPIDGLTQFKGKAPKFILVGEFIETNEAPAAFAELACHLAARQDKAEGPLFVGVSEYLGGATEAETRMRARLDALVAKGAPIVVGAIGGDDHPYSVHNRTAAEKEWARNIENKAIVAGASRSILLMSRTDAIDEPILPVGERFSGYEPMATFLPKGEVLALEIRNAPQAGVSAPAIRLYPEMSHGFHGQIALASLTRPAVELALARTAARPPVALSISDARARALLAAPMPREQKIEMLAEHLRTGIVRGLRHKPSEADLDRLSRELASSLVDQQEAGERREPAAPAEVPLFPVDEAPAPD